MPLFADGAKKIRRAMELVAAGQRSPFVKVGIFTPEQLTAINGMRKEKNLDPIEATIVCNGKHLYESRCIKDGYSIDEMVEQIQFAFELATEAKREGWSTILRSTSDRIDKQGNAVRDELVFECTQRHPNANLFSAIPRGDGKGPQVKKRRLLEEEPSLKT